MSGQPITDAKNAAKAFVDIVDQSDGDLDGTITNSQVGVVDFDDVVTLTHPLSTNANTVKAAIDTLFARGATAIGGGINAAQGELTGPRHISGNSQAMVVLSDGFNNSGKDPLAAAFNAKAAGTEIFAIALGSFSDTGLMMAVASDPDETHYFHPLSSGDLDLIFEQIAQGISGAAATDLSVTDIIGPELTLEAPPSVTRGNAIVNGTTIAWSFGELRTETVTMSYELAVSDTVACGSSVATNASASLDYLNASGQPAALAFPSPSIVYGLQPCDSDVDGDGCTDFEENGSSPALGGGRKKVIYWDFFDVPVPPSYSRDKAISVADIAAVVARFGSSRPGGPPDKATALTEAQSGPPLPPAYHAAYDRTPSGAFLSGPPDGAISVQDISRAVAQFGHSCLAAP
jgi:hypothetical protein